LRATNTKKKSEIKFTTIDMWWSDRVLPSPYDGGRLCLQKQNKTKYILNENRRKSLTSKTTAWSS